MMDNKLIFCTLFDIGYLSKGLNMIQSLNENCEDYILYIFAFDDFTHKYFTEHASDNIVPISLKEFENEDLLKVKSDRTRGEYCWTSTPATIKYVLDAFKHDHCTYIDADLMFYSDPLEIVNELGVTNSILLTEHRYTKKYDQSEKSGKYCVQFQTFKNDTNGLIALNWWYDRCIEWCYNRHEDGKFGDQKYLDDWTERFQGVKVMENEGGGLAPWNIQQYDLLYENDVLMIQNIETKRKSRAIFYHFHYLNEYEKKYDMGTYTISKSVKEMLYMDYIKKVSLIQAELNKLVSYNNNQILKKEKSFIHNLRRKLMSINNYIDKN